MFFGSGGWEHIGYNKHHGCVMWGMAEHWRYTRDRKWMERAAAKLVKSCDWVTRERQATMAPNPDGTRPIEYGLLPAGGLEDVQDYWYWLATNASTAWGFQAVADALADYGHPEAARLQKDAKAYRDDVLRASPRRRSARRWSACAMGRTCQNIPPRSSSAAGRWAGAARRSKARSAVQLVDDGVPCDLLFDTTGGNALAARSARDAARIDHRWRGGGRGLLRRRAQWS